MKQKELVVSFTFLRFVRLQLNHMRCSVSTVLTCSSLGGPFPCLSGHPQLPQGPNSDAIVRIQRPSPLLNKEGWKGTLPKCYSYPFCFGKRVSRGDSKKTFLIFFSSVLKKNSLRKVRHGVQVIHKLPHLSTCESREGAVHEPLCRCLARTELNLIDLLNDDFAERLSRSLYLSHFLSSSFPSPTISFTIYLVLAG
jgi:hypothetical protein